MEFTRRDLSFLMGALAAVKAGGQSRALASQTHLYADLPVHVDGLNRGRAILEGDTHTGQPVELHETELAPGQAPHPPHHHEHEEMLLVREGTMEVTIAGRTVKLDPGSVAYVASNAEHGWRNVGTTRARYWVLALGRDSGA
jgi:quercetin dioxygenase-like cupin family protein